MRTSPPSIRVVEEVARREGIDPIEVSPPLETVIDTDALDALVRSDRAPVEIAFEYRGYAVRVRGGPTAGVSVREATAPVDATGPEPIRETDSNR